MPTEVESLVGEVKTRLVWSPRVTFEELVLEMMREDLKEAEQDKLCKQVVFCYNGLEVARVAIKNAINLSILG